MNPHGPPRGRGGYGISNNPFEYIASPMSSQYNPRVYGSAHNSLETSPSFKATSLPQRTLSRDSSKNTIIATNRNFTFLNMGASNSHRSYPSVFVNGAIVDVNEIVRDIIFNKPHSKYTGPDIGTQSLICPLSHVPITCPVRGTYCNHAQCFDLREFLIAQDNEIWMCPICNQRLTIETIGFDPFYFACTVPNIQVRAASNQSTESSDHNEENWESREAMFENFEQL